jgi:hypothetical protein
MRLIARFRWGEHLPAFKHPMPAAARTVIFEPLFRRSSHCLYVDPFSLGAAQQIRDFRPAVMAGTLQKVLAFGGELSPSHGLVVFSWEGGLCLSDADRDDLWDAYRVPVFEQVITSAGHLAAWECEAHEGLHLADGAQAMADRIVVGRCDCGADAPRVLRPTMAPRLTGERDLPMLLLPAPLRSGTQPLPT